MLHFDFKTNIGYGMNGFLLILGHLDRTFLHKTSKVPVSCFFISCHPIYKMKVPPYITGKGFCRNVLSLQ